MLQKPFIIVIWTGPIGKVDFMHDYLVQEIQKNFPKISTKIISGLDEPPAISIKIHPYKKPLQWNFILQEPVPWSKFGFYLMERPSFIQDPLWHAGTYYVQEASSMFLDFLIEQILHQTSDINWKILDACAAPGGKTWSLASLFPPHSFILANEMDCHRVNILNQNVILSGFPNVYVSNNRMEEFPKEPIFHFILVDAPCSGEGMFRKHVQQLQHNLNQEYIQVCIKRQQQILNQVKNLLLPGGFLVYSTCTFNLEENEKNIAHFLEDNPDFETTFFEIPALWNVYISEYQKVIFYRFFPGFIKGEGFSITVLRKKGNLENPNSTLPLKKDKHKTLQFVQDHVKNPDTFSFFSKNQNYFAILKPHFSFWEYLQTELKMIKNGIFLGTIKGKDFIPEHEWVLSNVANTDIFPSVMLSKEEALSYLHKQNFNLNFENIGIHVLKYNNIPLGLANNIGKRWNNMLPNSFKIKKL